MRHFAKHLIIVPGHAPFKAFVKSVPVHPEMNTYWALDSFQQSEPPLYIEHMRHGVHRLKYDSQALLIFSGGRTRKASGRWSEAATYSAITQHFHYWQKETEDIHLLSARTDLDIYARDSFENLQFSLYRFYQLTGSYPEHVTVVGWKFKHARFELHRKTLGIPKHSFTYIGCNNPVDITAAELGEARTVAAFRVNPTGDQSPLSNKRLQRNPFNQHHTYANLPTISSHILV